MFSERNHRSPKDGLPEKVVLVAPDKSSDNLSLPQFSDLALRSPINEYAELKRRMKQKGLMDQQPAYYTYKILFTLGLLAFSLTFLLVANHSSLHGEISGVPVPPIGTVRMGLVPDLQHWLPAQEESKASHGRSLSHDHPLPSLLWFALHLPERLAGDTLLRDPSSTFWPVPGFSCSP